nr:MAG TPA: hypothetical protein [Caudoviricetes sp.]
MIDEKDNGVITNYYKDLSTGRPIVKIKTEKQTVNSLKNVIQLMETPDEQERVTIVDSTDMIEVDNYEDLTEENQYWVDYKNPLGNIYFHPSKKAQTYNIKYGSKGYTLISANKIFTKLDEDGNVVEVLSDILEQGRDIIDELLILGGGVQVFYKLQQAIADGSELHTNLQSDISTGQPLHTQLRKDINDANTFKDQLNEDVADGKILDESLKVQNPRAEQNLANLNQAMTDCADDIANITKTDNGVAIVTTENWGSVDSEGFYHCTVTHTANSKDLNLDIFDYTNNIQGESVFVTVTPLTDTTFKVSSIENTPIKIVFASGYYGGYTSANTRDAINGLENEKQNKLDNLLETTNKSIPLAINEVKSQLEDKVNKEQGKGLSTNDYDNVAKAEVAKIKNKADTTRVDDLERQIGQGVTDEQLKNAVQAKVDDGTINSIQVGKDGVDTINLRNESVTVEKTDFAEKIEVDTSDVILNDLFTIVGSLSPTTGNLNAGNTAYKSTNFIDVSKSEFCFRYVLDGLISSKFTDFMCVWYIENKAYLSGTNQGTNYSVEQYNGKYGVKYQKPEGAKWVRFSCNVANCIGGNGNLYTYLKVESVYDTKLSGRYYENYIEEQINNSPTSSKPLQGKKMVVFADSIFGNFRDETGICSIIAKTTGMEVINCGLGGTRMSGRNDSNSQAIYWDKFSASRIVDYIKDNDYSPMEEALPNMSSALPYFQEVINILKGIDWYSISIVGFALGTNDATGFNKIKNPDNLSDIYSYYGAYCHAIETLLETYPHLRIILFTPMYRFWHDNGVFLYDSDTHELDGQTLPQFVDCVKEVGKKYHLPVVDEYYELDANKFTRSMYFNATDGTHPHEGGRKRRGERISHQIEILI